MGNPEHMPEQDSISSEQRRLEATYGNASIVISDGRREFNEIKIKEKGGDITSDQAQGEINHMRKTYEKRLDSVFKGSKGKETLLQMALGEIFNP